MRLEEVIHESIGPGLKELDSVWEYIGYEEDQRSVRLQSLADSMQRCLFDFISAENQHRVDLESRIESLKRKAAQVCQSLRLPPYFPPRGLASLQLLRRLEEHIAQYQVEIVARQGKFSQLMQGIGRLCSRLGLDAGAEIAGLPAAGDRPDEFIPSEQDLDKATRKLADLQTRHDALMKQFVGFCEDIRRIASDIEYLPETESESAILRASSSLNAPPAQWPLTQGSLAELQSWRLRLVKHKAMLVGTCDELRCQVGQLRRRLKLGNPSAADTADAGDEFLMKHRGYRPSDMTALREELARCQELRRGPAAAAYANSLRAEAAHLSALCFSETAAAIDSRAGDDLDQLEDSVDQLRRRYEQSRELYDTVRLYQQTWDAYMEVEQRMKDPSIFSNRGGILLRTEKEKKALTKELPRVEAKVAEQLKACPGGDRFRIRGMTFQQYAQHLWDELRSDREAAKQSRRQSSAVGRVSIVGSGSAQDLSALTSRKSLAPAAAAAAAAATAAAACASAKR